MFNLTRMVTKYLGQMAYNPDASRMGDAHSLSSKGGENENLPSLTMGSERVGRWETLRDHRAQGELLVAKGLVREGLADGGLLMTILPNSDLSNLPGCASVLSAGGK